MLARSRRRALSLVLALTVPAIALVPLAASGEPKPKTAKPSEKEYDPDNVVAISQFMETIGKGNERFIAKDTTAAIDAYKKAIQLSPRNGLGYYLLAEAYLVNGNLPEADAALQQAIETTDATKSPAMRARVLFLTADVKERQKKWADAKLAWQAYAEQAAKSPGGGDAGVYPQSGVERIKALQRVLDLDKAYAAVRERIASEKADAGKTPPKKP